MKKRFLKNYDQYLNEHFAVFFNRDEQISKFDNVVSEEEETTKDKCKCGEENCKCDENIDESEEELDIVTDIESDGELDGNTTPEPVEDIETTPEEAKDDIDTDTVKDIPTSYSPTTTSPREFSVVKVMTNNGEKIMMCYTCDVDDDSSLADNLDFVTACERVKKECVNTGLTEFNKKNDINLGSIPTFMMDKKNNKEGGSTSYRP